MAANPETSNGSDDTLQDSLDEAALNMAGLTLQNDNDTILLEAQFDLIKFLVRKVGAAIEALLSTAPTAASLQADFQHLVKLSRLIDKVERDNYHGTEEEERQVQDAVDVLVAAYAGDPETAERIRIVVAVEKSVGHGDSRAS